MFCKARRGISICWWNGEQKKWSRIYCTNLRSLTRGRTTSHELNRVGSTCSRFGWVWVWWVSSHLFMRPRECVHPDSVVDRGEVQGGYKCTSTTDHGCGCGGAAQPESKEAHDEWRPLVASHRLKPFVRSSGTCIPFHSIRLFSTGGCLRRYRLECMQRLLMTSEFCSSSTSPAGRQQLCRDCGSQNSKSICIFHSLWTDRTGCCCW